MLHRLAVGWGRFVKLFHNKPTEEHADRKAAVPVLEKTAGKTEAIAEEKIDASIFIEAIPRQINHPSLNQANS